MSRVNVARMVIGFDAEVRLFGLSKIEYNGLKGVVRGPAEKDGRSRTPQLRKDYAAEREANDKQAFG